MKNTIFYIISLCTLFGCTKESYIEPVSPYEDDSNSVTEVINEPNYHQIVMGDDANVTFKIYSNWGSASIITTQTESDTVMHWIGVNEVMDTTVTYHINSGESINIYTWGYSCFIELDVLVNDEFMYTVYDDGQQGVLNHTYQN